MFVSVLCSEVHFNTNLLLLLKSFHGGSRVALPHTPAPAETPRLTQPSHLLFVVVHAPLCCVSVRSAAPDFHKLNEDGELWLVNQGLKETIRCYRVSVKEAAAAAAASLLAWTVLETACDWVLLVALHTSCVQI